MVEKKEAKIIIEENKKKNVISLSRIILNISKISLSFFLCENVISFRVLWNLGNPCTNMLGSLYKL